MSSITFYQHNATTKYEIFRAIGDIIAIPPAAVEKDWWVVQTLRLIWELDVAKHLVFKGGTSLSKAWQLIERFSEDIDLSLDKRFLGINECNTVKQVKKLRSASRKYLYDVFIPDLHDRFKRKGFESVKVVLNESEGKNLEPVQIIVLYETCTPPSNYTTPEVKIEIGSRSLREPFTNRKISSFVSEHFPDKPFADIPVMVPCVNPERTFMEKLFLLHEEFQKPSNEIRVTRLSRHLYDIERLMNTKFAEIALKNKKLYNEIIQHRCIYTKISGIDYSLHQPKTLNPLPPAAIINAWEKDYKSMQEEMIYGESIPFDKLIERIGNLKAEINNIIW